MVDLRRQVDYDSGAVLNRRRHTDIRLWSILVGKRPLTPTYIFFYILFWPDTWRIVIGVAAALILVPRILPSEQSVLRLGMVYVMIACIGYALSSAPAGGITRGFKRLLLKKDSNGR